MTCFPNVMSRKKLEGFEVDIFIPDLSIGIEYDGSYWHTDKQDHDLKKQAALEALGVKLLRVREKPLSKISANDIIVERAEELRKETVNKLFSLLSLARPYRLQILLCLCPYRRVDVQLHH